MLLMLNSDSVVSVARQLSTASDLVSFLASSKALVELMPHDAIQTLWRTMAVQRFPRAQALAAALQYEDYRRLYRAQLFAERERHRPDAQVERAISEYVFTVELYSCTAGEPEDVFGTWTGRFVQELSCNVWQPGGGPAWTQLPTVQRNETTNFNDLYIRVTVTKLSPHMGISTLILYDGNFGLDGGEVDLDQDFIGSSSLPGTGLYVLSDDAVNASLALGGSVWLPQGRVKIDIILEVGDDPPLIDDMKQVQVLTTYLNELAPWGSY